MPISAGPKHQHPHTPATMCGCFGPDRILPCKVFAVSKDTDQQGCGLLCKFLVWAGCRQLGDVYFCFFNVPQPPKLPDNERDGGSATADGVRMELEAAAIHDMKDMGRVRLASLPDEGTGRPPGKRNFNRELQVNSHTVAGPCLTRTNFFRSRGHSCSPQWCSGCWRWRYFSSGFTLCVLRCMNSRQLVRTLTQRDS